MARVQLEVGDKVEYRSDSFIFVFKVLEVISDRGQYTMELVEVKPDYGRGPG